MKVKQACRRDRPGGEPQGKGGALTNRGQKESSVCFSSISIAKLSLCFELCKACAVFLRRCLLISIFPMAELEYVCSPSGRGEGGELRWREDGATKRNRCEKRGAVRRKRGTKQKYSRRPIHFFPTVFVPLLSERVLRRPESTPCAPIACARTLASTGFRFLPSLLHPNATLCCD